MTQAGINFISTDKKHAIDSYGDTFSVGDVVVRVDNTRDQATITSFEIDEESNEVKAITTEGWAHLDFVIKLDKNRIVNQISKTL